jgi:RNA polymerase sigma-70 factor (ECF subfamily)
MPTAPGPAAPSLTGDHPALSASAAFADNFDDVLRALRRFGVAGADVEDLAQDVFVVVCRRWSAYRPDMPIRPWLTGIAFNVARRYLGRVWREVPAGEIDREDLHGDPDHDLQAAQARRLVRTALAALPARDRAVLILHELEGLPIREVAEALAVPRFTAYTRLRQARVRVARLVAQLQRPGPARVRRAILASPLRRWPLGRWPVLV